MKNSILIFYRNVSLQKSRMLSKVYPVRKLVHIYQKYKPYSWEIPLDLRRSPDRLIMTFLHVS